MTAWFEYLPVRPIFRHYLERLGETLGSLGPWPAVTASEPGIHSASQELIEELMGAVVTIGFLLETLMALPAEALPGEGGSEGIRELLVASACREVEPVGEEGCRSATALLRKVVDGIADDVESRGSCHWRANSDPADGARPFYLHKPCRFV